MDLNAMPATHVLGPRVGGLRPKGLAPQACGLGNGFGGLSLGIRPRL